MLKQVQHDTTLISFRPKVLLKGNDKTGYKQILTPEGYVEKQTRFEGGIKKYVTYNPLTEEGNMLAIRGGYTVPCNQNGVLFNEMAGLNLLF